MNRGARLGSVQATKLGTPGHAAPAPGQQRQCPRHIVLAGQPLPRPKVSFTHAKPSLTHQVLLALMRAGKLDYLGGWVGAQLGGAAWAGERGCLCTACWPWRILFRC